MPDTPDDLSPAEARAVRKALRDAHARGLAAGELRERERLTGLVRFAASLNGSTRAVLKALDASGHEHAGDGKFTGPGGGGGGKKSAKDEHAERAKAREARRDAAADARSHHDLNAPSVGSGWHEGLTDEQHAEELKKHWDDHATHTRTTRRKLEAAGATEKELAEFDRRVSKARAGIERHQGRVAKARAKAVAARKAADEHDALRDAIEAEEPEKPTPEDEPDEPEKPESPTSEFPDLSPEGRPDRGDYDSDGEHDDAVAQWESDVNDYDEFEKDYDEWEGEREDWREECADVAARNEKAEAAHEKARAAWEKRLERHDEKAERLTEKADDAESDHDAADDEYREEYEDGLGRVGEHVSDVEDRIISDADAGDEADPEPDDEDEDEGEGEGEVPRTTAKALGPPPRFPWETPPAGVPGGVNTERDPDRAGVRKAAVHAPKGGASVGGKKYRGGEFVPGEVVAAATPDEKRELGIAEEAEEAEEWDGAIDQDGVNSANTGYSDRNLAQWSNGDGEGHEIWVEEGEYATPAGDDVTVYRFVSFDGDEDREHEGEWVSDRADAKRAGRDYASENHVEPRDPEDADIADSDVSGQSWGDRDVIGNYTSEGGDEFTVRLEEGTFEFGGREHECYRWTTRRHDDGEWTLDRDQAVRDGEEYAEENHVEPEEEEEEEEESPEYEDTGGDKFDVAKLPPPKKRDVSLAGEKLSRSAARFEVAAGVDEGEVDALAGKVFGGASPEENRRALVACLGMPDDATVRASRAGDYQTLFSDDKPMRGAVGVRVSVDHPKMGRVFRFVGIDHEGRRFIKNEIVEIKPAFQGEGLGADIFAKQVEAAASEGIDYIATHAAGGPGEKMNGYYTWPRFGYDQRLDSPASVGRAFDEARARFPGAESILDVMSTKEGRDWWKDNGKDLYDAKFDLDPAGRSMAVMSAYQGERAAKRPARPASPAPTPAATTPASPPSKSPPSTPPGGNSKAGKGKGPPGSVRKATADPLALLSEAMLAHAEESLAAGDDPAPGLDRLRELADAPAALAELLAGAGADAGTVGKCFLVLKAGKYDEEKHPRDDKGRYVSKDAIADAKGDPKAEAKLREKVTNPEQRKKLDAALSGETDLGRTKRGQSAHEAAGRRTTREEGRAKTAALLSHLAKVGDLRAKLTADDLHDLADHLQSGHPTVGDVRAMRKALAGAGQGLASFGGAKRKDAMVAALVAHAKGKAFDARVKEQGFDADEMRAALAPTPEPAAAGAEPPAVEPTLQELETGVRPGGGRRAQFADPMSRPYRREEANGAAGLDRGAVQPPAGRSGRDATDRGMDGPTGATAEGEPATDQPRTGGETEGVGAATQRPSGVTPGTERSKVEYVRAAAGGQTSDVDGRFYAGGQLMPVHGRFSGQAKPPKGDGTGAASAPADPNSDGGEGEGGFAGRPPGGPQGTPEERREKAERQAKWDEMNRGILGQVTWLGNSPNAKGMRPGVEAKRWKEFAERTGEAGMRAIVDALQPEIHDKIQQEGESRGFDQESIDWQKNEANRQAEQDASIFPGAKKHTKQVPSSLLARQVIQQHMQEFGGSVEGLHALEQKLQAATAPQSARPAGADDARPTAGEFAGASAPAAKVTPAPAKPARAAKPKTPPARPAWVAADPAASAALDAHAAAPGRAKDVIGNALANAGLYDADRDGNPTGPAAEPPESDSGRTPAQELAGALAAGHRDQHDLGHSDEEREATASLLRELGAVQVGEVGESARFDGAVHDGPPGAFTGHALTVTRPGWKVPLGGGRWWVPVKARLARPTA